MAQIIYACGCNTFCGAVYPEGARCPIHDVAVEQIKPEGTYVNYIGSKQSNCARGKCTEGTKGRGPCAGGDGPDDGSFGED